LLPKLQSLSLVVSRLCSCGNSKLGSAELQTQAQQQFDKLMASHSQRAFGNPTQDKLFHPVFPWAT
jgi:hypothetical protein